MGTAIAAATTLGIGYAAIAWFAQGEKITAETTRTYVEAVTREIITALRGIDRKSLSRDGIKAILESATSRVSNRIARSEPTGEK